MRSFGLCLLAASLAAAQAHAQAELEAAPEYEEELLEEATDDGAEALLEEAEAALPGRDVEGTVANAVAMRGRELSGAAYEFCRDPEFEPDSHRAARFCKTVDEAVEEVCPQAARLCHEREKRDPFKLPDWALYTLMTLALLVLGGGLGWFFVNVLRQWRQREAEPLRPLSASPVGLDLQSLPEAEALLLLRQALARLEAGQPAEAALLLHVAALRHFDATGLVGFHPSTTNGEYLRALRPHPELAGLFREIARLTDQLRFGDGTVEAERVAALVPRAHRLFSAPTARGAAMAPAAAVLLALGGLTGCEGQDSSFFSHRPEGLAALPALLAQAGVENAVVRRLPAEVAEEVGVVVLRADEPGLSWMNDGEQIGALLERDLAVLVLDDVSFASVLLPITSTVSSADLVPHPDPVAVEVTPEYFCRFDQAVFREEVLDTLPGALLVPRGVTMLPVLAEGPLPMLGRGAELIPLLVYADATESDPKVLAYGALRPDAEGGYEPGCLAVFSTSELFSNAALSHPRNLGYAVGLITSLLDVDESVLFVDGMQRPGAGGSVGGSMQSSKALPFVLHAGLWVAVLFVALGAAFGRLRDPIRTEHKAFREHAEALGLYYAASGPAGQAHAAEALARLVVARYRHRVRGGTKEAWAALAAHLAERHELDGPEVLSALSSGLEEGMRASIREDVTPLPPARSLEISSKILSNEGHLDRSKKGS